MASSPATAISGTLEQTGWFAGITRPQATFPDITPGQMGESTPPHFGVDISPYFVADTEQKLQE